MQCCNPVLLQQLLSDAEQTRDGLLLLLLLLLAVEVLARCALLPLFAFDECCQRLLLLAVQLINKLVAQPACRDVEHALEGVVVAGVERQPASRNKRIKGWWVSG